MTSELEDKLSQFVTNVDDVLGDNTQHVQAAYLEVLQFKTHAVLNVPAYNDAKKKLNELELLYIKLTITKEEYS